MIFPRHRAARTPRRRTSPRDVGRFGRGRDLGLRRGFTLIELLSVIGILGVLAALLLPAVQAAREAARRVGCANNMRQIGLALHGYHDAIGTLPMGYVATADPNPYATSPGWGWAAMVLPQIEKGTFFDSANFGLPVEDPSNLTTRVAAVSTYICPADRNPGLFTAVWADWSPVGLFYTNSYAACYGAGGAIDDLPTAANGLFRRNGVVRLEDVRDGTHSTIAIGERGACLVQTPWVGTPSGAVSVINAGSSLQQYAAGEVGVGGELVLAHVDQVNYNAPGTGPDDFYSPHPLGGYFLFADGSARFLANTINLGVLRALCTKDGGEIVDDGGY